MERFFVKYAKNFSNDVAIDMIKDSFQIAKDKYSANDNAYLIDLAITGNMIKDYVDINSSVIS